MKIICYIQEEDRGAWESNDVTNLSITKWLEHIKSYYVRHEVDCKIVIRSVIECGSGEDEDLLRELLDNSSIRIKQ